MNDGDRSYDGRYEGDRAHAAWNSNEPRTTGDLPRASSKGTASMPFLRSSVVRRSTDAP